MNRARALAAGLLVFGAWWPTLAPAQNLEAGKSPGQLFSNTCSACHRSPRGLLRSVPPGSLPGFLREHYTTSRDMAQQLSGFLISNGATDTRGRPQEVRQQPPGAEPARPPRPGEPELQARPQRPPEPEQQVRPQRPVAQEQAARPPEPQQARPDPREEARLSRRERRAKREAERKRLRDAAPAATAAAPAAERDGDRRPKNRRITPARIEAATARGKDALPLGTVVSSDPPADAAQPDAVASQPASEAVKPATAAAPSEPAMRSDPVPQVTPAPPSASTAEAPSETPADAQRGSDEAPSGSTAAEPPAPSPSGGPPPSPPISN